MSGGDRIVKSNINQVATYIAFEYGLDRKDVMYMLELLEKKA
jgi:hypothetical protein